LVYRDFKDDEESFRWFVRAAFGGEADAQYFISRSYTEGMGTIKNLQKAFFYPSRSEGNVKGLAQLGTLYRFGAGREVDLKKSFDYYKRCVQWDLFQSPF
jgi:TPR repeat protein